MKKILGLSAFYHDSAAAIVVDGKIVGAAQEERFTRKKHTAVFPKEAIKYCLDEAGVTIDELDAVVFYDKPFLKFERLLETYYAFAPKGILSFMKAIPVWLNEKLFSKKLLYDGLREIEKYDKKNLKLLFTEHHLSHAASAFYPSPFKEAAILTVDGVGEWSTASIAVGIGKSITIKKELHFPHSVGLLYSSFTYFLGFKVNSGEYKVMGLAPYGKDTEESIRFANLIKDELIEIKGDGSIWLNQDFFNYSTGLKMIVDKKWETLFGFSRREKEASILQCHCSLAFAIQSVLEEVVIKMAKEAKRITGSENLCLAGGVALNCTANGKLLESGVFKNIYIQPAAGDAGGALGAALSVYYQYFENTRKPKAETDPMNGTYLGPSFSEKEIIRMNKRQKAIYRKEENFEALTSFIAEKLEEGKIIGWFQGRMEFGPRALGNRSILGDARNPEMQKKINLKIKNRESFRPFAPAVLDLDFKDFFDASVDSAPYMLVTFPIKKERTKELHENFSEFSMMEKLNTQRSDIQAVTHVDYSARVQTVHQNTNERFWKLLNQFKEKTGYGLLVNTSFNVRGEPIVCTPEDAYTCFLNTEMDYLVINDFIYKKTALSEGDKKLIKRNFELD